MPKQAQFIFTLISRNTEGEIVTSNIPAANLQAAVAAFDATHGVLFAAYQNRNSAQSWLKSE